MISLKKSYARQLLQLALTLSLLRVDPENYLGWGWESQLALQNGDGWQLELRAAPLTDYPYSNRKALIPLIEDLVRFDRQTNPYDVQTYLLNVQNEQLTAMAPAPAQPQQPNNQQETNTTTTTTVTLQPQNATRNTTEFTVPIGSELADLFLNSDLFAESASVLDQNMADLNDYEGVGMANDDFANLNTLYAGLPLKDEPPDLVSNNLYNIHFNEPEQTASTSSDYGSTPPNRSDHYGLMRSPDSPKINYTQVIEWSEYFSENTIKKEKEESEAEDATANGTSVDAPSEQDSGIKLESDLEDDADDRSSHGSKNSTSGFSSNVELTEEVSLYISKEKKKLCYR